jgi:DHA2 family multidrug resistance protein
MTTAAAAAAIAVPRRSAGPWLVAVAVVIPTLMEVLDTTIKKVTIRYIAGGLRRRSRQRMGDHSYPSRQCDHPAISGWLAPSSAGATTSDLHRRVHGRVGAGGAWPRPISRMGAPWLRARGGGLQPSSQGVLLDAFPPNGRARQ